MHALRLSVPSGHAFKHRDGGVLEDLRHAIRFALSAHRCPRCFAFRPDLQWPCRAGGQLVPGREMDTRRCGCSGQRPASDALATREVEVPEAWALVESQGKDREGCPGQALSGDQPSCRGVWIRKDDRCRSKAEGEEFSGAWAIEIPGLAGKVSRWVSYETFAEAHLI